MTDSIRASFSAFLHNPTGIEFAGEDEGEKIVLLLRRHLITNIHWLFVAILLFFAPFPTSYILSSIGVLPLPYLYASVLTLFWYLIVVTFIFENYLNWYFNVYIVTDKRLIDVDFLGSLNVSVAEAPLSKVQDVTYTVQGISQTMFNYGDVNVQTAAEKPEVEFELVPRPAFVHDIISDLATGAPK